MRLGTPRCIVIGIGNPHRGDDVAGRSVARLLRPMLPDDVKVAEHDGEATDLVTCLDGVDTAFLVDACASGGSVGTVYRFDAAAAPLPSGGLGLSTHGFGFAEGIELARALGQFPRRCIVYAIEGGCFEMGAALSPQVRASVADVARRLCAEIVGQEHTDMGHA
jgi:hydrogenase maturation protease